MNEKQRLPEHWQEEKEGGMCCTQRGKVIEGAIGGKEEGATQVKVDLVGQAIIEFSWRC